MEQAFFQTPDQWVDVPWDSLAPGTLEAVLEEFVLREGTDYGEQEAGLTSKVAAVRQQLVRAEVFLIYDLNSERTHLVPRALYQRARRESGNE